MPTYDVNYADRGSALIIKANLAEGWRELKKTFGFFAHKRIHYRGDWTIRAQLSVIAQPPTFDEQAGSFPLLTKEYGGSLVSYALKERQLLVRIALNPDQPWRIMSTGRPGLYIEELPLLTLGDRLWFDLRAWIVFHAPPPAPVPDVRVWCQKLFVPGGQIEANRRRH